MPVLARAAIRFARRKKMRDRLSLAGLAGPPRRRRADRAPAAQIICS
ncbi:hypothetical protein BSIN_3199 [Burkholderia singularis]|uniref:Uncharacterized protein n=1 Tax=Burkholderia singularis TaxID=1503053 RepID=A0A238H4E4_9BURK|nr:hypothetical protein BSIN_3199 [Burkholderia singularis]